MKRFKIIRYGNNNSNSNHNNSQQTNSNQTSPKFLSDEWFVLNFLKDWTSEDICLAIDNNIDLSKLLSENLENPIALMLTGITGKYDVMDERVNISNILQWFKDNRPDLYNVFTSKRDGVKWLTENTLRLKKMLRNI